MRHFTEFGNVLKRKARIYAWLLVGFVPIWTYGLIEGSEQLDSPAGLPFEMTATVLSVASLWIVIWRWEAVERRKIARRVRILLFGISLLMGFAIFGAFYRWCLGMGHGMYLPLTLSSAPLSVLPIVVHLGLGSASALGPVWGPFKVLAMSLIQWGTPVLWGTMAVLAASPRTRRRARLFLGTVLSHYLIGLLALVSMTARGWQCLYDTWRTAPEAVAGWALVYVGAHVLLWWSFLKNRIKSGRATAVASSQFRTSAGIPDPE